MKMQRTLPRAIFMTAIMVAGITVIFLAARFTDLALGSEQLTPPPSPSDPKNAEDEKAIRKSQDGYVAAFNAGDAKALAAFWTTDGEFTDVEGKTFKGREAIAKEFASFFAESKGMKLEIHTDSLRFITPDVALESGTARIIRESDGDSHVTSYHVVHSKRDGQWLLASVRESIHVASSNYERLRSLEWLVGNWVAKNGEKSLEISCEWTAKRNFILRKYALKSAGGTDKSGLQIIGWDPAAGAIRCWTFDSDGGFGSGQWNKDGKRWAIKEDGVTRDGAQSTATNILTPVDHDNFHWQSVSRTLDQVRLDDTAIIKVTRVKAKK
jgi:uncharacterized protein (TIGR02246 family)